MPAKLKVDWLLAQTLFTQGLAFKVIAEQLNIKEQTLRKHSKRHKWPEIMSIARTEMSKVLTNAVQRKTNTVQQRADEWVLATVDNVERTHSVLNGTPIPDDLMGLSLYEDVMGKHVKRGRSVFGLDKEQGSVTVNVGVFARPQLADSDQARVIDIQSTTAQIEDNASSDVQSDA